MDELPFPSKEGEEIALPALDGLERHWEEKRNTVIELVDSKASSAPKEDKKGASKDDKKAQRNAKRKERRAKAKEAAKQTDASPSKPAGENAS